MSPESKKKKAYIVTLEFEIPVLADNEEEAKDFMRDATRDDLYMQECCTVRPLTYMPDGFRKDDLVYCDGEDIALEELCEHSPEYQNSIANFNKRMESVKRA